ncbi:unnamed protein product [Cochlearia groenlandica]
MEQPSSPGTKPVEIGETLESLLLFTLRSHVEEHVPSFDLELPRDLCLNLLKEDTEKPAVYKVLAKALSECIISEEFHGLGHGLLNMLKKVNFELHVQELYFTQLKDGLKTVEGRCAVGDYLRISSGAFILFNKCLLLEVQDVEHYTSFSEMLRLEGLSVLLPGVQSIEQGLKIFIKSTLTYRKRLIRCVGFCSNLKCCSICEGVGVYRNFYPEEKERKNGVLAIRVAKPVDQPYVALAGVLSELKSTGIKRLLDDYTSRVTL